jgi:hypothetical protein
MSKNYPDNWVVLQIATDGDAHLYKLLGGWSGSYLSSNSWQLNSGIVKVEESDLYWTFHGVSGSQYVCHKKAYGLKMNNSGICKQILEEFPDAVTMMSEKTDWANLV